MPARWHCASTVGLRRPGRIWYQIRRSTWRSTTRTYSVPDVPACACSFGCSIANAAPITNANSRTDRLLGNRGTPHIGQRWASNIQRICHGIRWNSPPLRISWVLVRYTTSHLAVSVADARCFKLAIAVPTTNGDLAARSPFVTSSRTSRRSTIVTAGRSVSRCPW